MYYMYQKPLVSHIKRQNNPCITNRQKPKIEKDIFFHVLVMFSFQELTTQHTYNLLFNMVSFFRNGDPIQSWVPAWEAHPPRSAHPCHHGHSGR